MAYICESFFSWKIVFFSDFCKVYLRRGRVTKLAIALGVEAGPGVVWAGIKRLRAPRHRLVEAQRESACDSLLFRILSDFNYERREISLYLTGI